MCWGCGHAVVPRRKLLHPACSAALPVHPPPGCMPPGCAHWVPLGTHLMAHLARPLSPPPAGMFITAMAANPLAVNLAAETLGQTISWGAHLLA